jgi:hypothetical protein
LGPPPNKHHPPQAATKKVSAHRSWSPYPSIRPQPININHPDKWVKSLKANGLSEFSEKQKRTEESRRFDEAKKKDIFGGISEKKKKQKSLRGGTLNKYNRDSR